jgi:hypothetical protein
VNENQEGDVDVGEQPSPLLLVGLTFAPKHKSGILVRNMKVESPTNEVYIAHYMRLFLLL